MYDTTDARRDAFGFVFRPYDEGHIQVLPTPVREIDRHGGLLSQGRGISRAHYTHHFQASLVTVNAQRPADGALSRPKPIREIFADHYFGGISVQLIKWAAFFQPYSRGFEISLASRAVIRHLPLSDGRYRPVTGSGRIVIAIARQRKIRYQARRLHAWKRTDALR